MRNKKLKIMEGLQLFCEGAGCPLRDRCHRYTDGRDIDRHAAGYSWMSACDDDEHNGFIPMGSK